MLYQSPLQLYAATAVRVTLLAPETRMLFTQTLLLRQEKLHSNNMKMRQGINSGGDSLLRVDNSSYK